jgi:DNA ligase (NAD+)
VGRVVAETLVEHFPSIDKLLAADSESLEAVDGIGPILAHNLVDWFATAHNRNVVEKLRAAGVALSAASVQASSETLLGSTFVITGTLPQLSREQAASLIRSHGGKVTAAVSGSTSYLVAGESAGSKLAKAEKLEVPILDEEGLRKLIS